MRVGRSPSLARMHKAEPYATGAGVTCPMEGCELGILLAGARGGALLLPLAAGCGRLARGAGTALHLGRRLGYRNLAGGGGLSRHERLRLVDLLVLGGDDLFGLRRRRRRMELGSEEHDEAAFFVDLVAHQSLVLRIVQQLAQLLGAVPARLEVGALLLNPFEEFVGSGAGIDVETMNFEDVAQ